MGGQEELREAEFGFPGEQRDRIVRAILDGGKTATASLLLEYELHPGDSVPAVGERFAVVDSDGRRVGVIETTEVRILAFGEVDEQFARDEGEGFETVEDWRRAHVRFWEGEPMKAVLGRLEFRIEADTQIVAERFRLVEPVE